MSSESTATVNPLGVVQDALDSFGVAFVQEEPQDLRFVGGRTFKGKTYDYSMPTVVLDRRSTSTSPLALWFTTDLKTRKVKLHFQFVVEPQLAGKQPFFISDFKLQLRIHNEDGKDTWPQLHVNPILPVDPQRISGYTELTLPEFVNLKNVLGDDPDEDGGSVTFRWEGNVKWVLLSDFKAFSETQDNSVRSSLIKSKYVHGEVPVSIPEDDEEAYAGVKGLLNWESEHIESEADPNGYDIWFKDTMEANTYYFLPQVFRIKADPETNAPKMTVTFVRDPGVDARDFSAYTVRLNFEMGPYYHPRAERDLYRVMKRRAEGRIKVCNIKYGGYESATFTMQTTEGLNAAFSLLGVKALIEGEIKTNPDSSFQVSLETSMDCYNHIRDTILTEDGLYIGDVNVTVKEGLDGNLKVIQLPARLSLQSLTGYNLEIRPLESTEKKIKFPYQVEVINRGAFPVRIGDSELSMVSEKKQAPRDVMHELKTNESWGFELSQDERRTFTLCDNDIQKLNKKNTGLFGLQYRKYWTKLICQPYHVRVLEKYLLGFLDDVQDHAKSHLDVWHVRIKSLLDWEGLPDVECIELQIVNDRYNINKTVELNAKSTPPPINMCDSLTAILDTQFIENQTFRYRFRAILKERNTPWGEFHEESGDAVYVRNSAITELINLV